MHLKQILLISTIMVPTMIAAPADAEFQKVGEQRPLPQITVEPAVPNSLTFAEIQRLLAQEQKIVVAHERELRSIHQALVDATFDLYKVCTLANSDVGAEEACAQISDFNIGSFYESYRDRYDMDL